MFSLWQKHFSVNPKNALAWTWMTEKYFAATPFTCHNQFLICILLFNQQLRIALWSRQESGLKSKDFKGIYVRACKNQLHFSG